MVLSIGGPERAGNRCLSAWALHPTCWSVRARAPRALVYQLFEYGPTCGVSSSLLLAPRNPVNA